MKRYRLTLAAETDLQSIARYTKRQWGQKQRDQYIGKIKLRIGWFAESPQLGKRRPEIFEDLYSFPEGEHVIFYRILPDRIDIVGIPHRLMDTGGYFSSGGYPS
jgi:toxin ParE1/3/4